MSTTALNSSSNSSNGNAVGAPGPYRMSPPVPPYISPGLTPSPASWSSTGTFRPPPPFTLSEQQQHMHALHNGGGGYHLAHNHHHGGGGGVMMTEKRAVRPADPTKYKTEMCRNWEMSGTCSYRQCTFAHGADELRKPMAAAPQPVAPPQISAVERIMDAIVTEIRGERDLQFQQHESNRALEAALRRTQQERVEEQRQLEVLEGELAALRAAIADREERIKAIESEDVQQLLANLRRLPIGA